VGPLAAIERVARKEAANMSDCVIESPHFNRNYLL
jgi:hypothetical protein